MFEVADVQASVSWIWRVAVVVVVAEGHRFGRRVTTVRVRMPSVAAIAEPPRIPSRTASRLAAQGKVWRICMRLPYRLTWLPMRAISFQL